MKTETTISRLALLSAIENATRYGGKSPKAILSKTCRFAINGNVRIDSTDCERIATHEIEHVTKSGADAAFVVSAPECVKVLKATKAETVGIEFDAETGRALFRVGAMSIDVATQSSDEFPLFEKNKSAEFVTVQIPAGELRNAIKATIVAADVESSRYALGGVLFEFDESGNGQLVGTDGRRLHCAKIGNGCETAATPQNVIVPVAFLKSLVATLGKTKSNVVIQLPTKTDFIWVETDGARFGSRLMEGRFPKWRDVIKRHHRNYPIDAVAIADTLTQISSLTTDECRGADFQFSRHGCLVQFESVNNCAIRQIGKQPVNSSVSIGLDVFYFQDAIKTPYGAEIIRLGNELEPVLIESENGVFCALVAAIERKRKTQ